MGGDGPIRSTLPAGVPTPSPTASAGSADNADRAGLDDRFGFDMIALHAGRCPYTVRMSDFGLFMAAFLAATLLPAQSEAVLVALLLEGHSPWRLVAVASIGNVLGSTVNWWLGREIARFGDRRWFPVKPEALERARGWYARRGRWTLLLSWVPVIGDPLTLAAGMMRERFLVFLALVGFAKTARYVALAMAVMP